MNELELHAQVSAAVKKARLDPVWFLQKVTHIETTDEDRRLGVNWDLDPWQKEFAEAVADVYRHKVGATTKYNRRGKNLITVRAMHGPGKTFGVAGIMHWFNFCFRGTIVATAPKEKQLRTRLWPAFRKIRQRAGPAYSSLIHVDASKATWCGDEDWAAHAETASEPENLAGYHDEHLLFVVEEASGIREEMFPAIEGAVSAGFLTILILIGNPTKNRGTFYDSHMTDKVSKHYHKIHVDLSKTKRVSPEWVAKMKEKYGQDSPVFKIRCKGEFAEDGANQVIAMQWLADAKDRDFYEDGSLPRLRVSVDVADGGEDETVISVRRIYETCDHYLKVKRYSFPSSRAVLLSAQVAAEMFEKYGGDYRNGDDLVVDSLGVGAGTAGYLMEGIVQEDGTRRSYPVIPYKGGEASDDPAEWRCRRVQSYMVGRDALREGRVIFADDCFEDEQDWDDFCAQMCSVLRKEGLDQKEDLETKREMRARGLKSPDMADAHMMQYATQLPVFRGGHGTEDFGINEADNYDAGLI